MFKLKKNEIQGIIDMEQAKLARIEERMQLLESEGQVETIQEIRIKAENAQQFLSLKAHGKEEDIPDLFRTFIIKRNSPIGSKSSGRFMERNRG